MSCIMSKKSTVVVGNKRDYADRNQADRERFDEFTITTQNAVTVLEILNITEYKVLLAAMNHLDKYIEKAPQNAIKMLGLNIIDRILERKLHLHEELYIRRFALKILSELFETNPKLEYEMLMTIFEFTNSFYLYDTDAFCVEYAAVILFYMLDEPRIIVILEQHPDFFDGLFTHLRTTNDPDILYHSLKILIKLLHSITSNTCHFENLPLACILNMCTSKEFAEIKQTALEAILELSLCAYSQEYSIVFKSSLFFSKLMPIIEEPIDANLNNIINTMTIFKNVNKHEDVARVFCNENYLTKFFSIVNRIEILLPNGLLVLCEIAQFEAFRDLLYHLRFTETLMDYIQKVEINGIYEEMCLGIKRMLNHPNAAEKIIDRNLVPLFIRILTNENSKWKTREAAADALNALGNLSKLMCKNMLSNRLTDVIIKLFDRIFGDVPIDFQLSLINILNTFTKYFDLKKDIMTENFTTCLVKKIIDSFRSGILVANLLKCACGYINDVGLQKKFLKNNVASIVIRFLNSPSTFVRASGTDFITLTTTYEPFFDEYLEHKVLEKLLKDEKSSLVCCPSWSGAIEAILAQDLSVKFCVRERLDMNDLTGPKDFYVSKRHFKDFKILKCIMKEECSPFYPLLLTTYNRPDTDPSSVVFIPGSTPESAEWKYCRKPADDALPKYLKNLRDLLETRGLMDNRSNSAIDITKIPDRAKIVAEVVATELCGNKKGPQSIVCAEHIVLNHLNQLKCQLHCNIIPVGKIRFGGHFERALLFKSLADQIGLPATLEKSVDGRILYNTIPIPNYIDSTKCIPNKDKNTCIITKLPRRILHPTHIIDLMDSPGELYPIESREGYRYLRLV